MSFDKKRKLGMFHNIELRASERLLLIDRITEFLSLLPSEKRYYMIINLNVVMHKSKKAGILCILSGLLQRVLNDKNISKITPEY